MDRKAEMYLKTRLVQNPFHHIVDTDFVGFDNGITFYMSLDGLTDKFVFVTKTLG